MWRVAGAASARRKESGNSLQRPIQAYRAALALLPAAQLSQSGCSVAEGGRGRASTAVGGGSIPQHRPRARQCDDALHTAQGCTAQLTKW